MARIRTVKPEFWGDEKLAPMAPIDRLVFLGLVGMADDAGRILDSVKVVDAFVFPYTDDTSGPSLDVLANASRIIRGVTLSGQRVIQIANWSRHQRVDHPNVRACLPEIVVGQEVTEIRERFPRHSRGIRAPTYDQRPVPTTDEDDQRLPPGVMFAAAPHLGEHRLARIGEIEMLLAGMRGARVSPEAVARGLSDMAVAGAKFTPVALKRFAERAVGLLQGEAGQRAAQGGSSVLGHPDANPTPSGGWSEDEVES